MLSTDAKVDLLVYAINQTGILEVGEIDKSSIDFVDSIVNMDTSGKLEVLYEDADTILSAPFAKMYTIKNDWTKPDFLSL